MNRLFVRGVSAARTIAVMGLVSACALSVLERPAAACGGCFHPPDPERPTVVTDHRMVLAVGRGKSTLYDQIRYTGNPREFAWVLPITGEVEVGVSSDALVAGLDAFTQTEVFGPPRNCPLRPADCNGSGFGCGSASDSLTSAERGGAPGEVVVTAQKVVGPYATVQIQSTDPNALVKWLGDNGYAIGDDIKPVVQQYVKETFNFLALKLKPGASVQSMRPIRVTTTGPAVVLPLRMVAAGAGAVVGITLWTVAEGRYEPQNFPAFRIADTDVSWDWTRDASNFRDVRAERTAATRGRGWEMEASVELKNGAFPVASPSRFSPGGGFAPQEPAPTNQAKDFGYDSDGQKSGEQLLADDMAALYDGRAQGSSRLTRMRVDLAKNLLSEDLVLTASVDQGLLSNRRQITRELNEPACTVWVGCEANGTAPRSEAVARSTDHCSTAGTALPRETWAAGCLGFAAVAVLRRRAKRRAAS